MLKDYHPKRSSLTLEFNEGFSRAFHMMEDTDRHVFVTGRAGTGKSTLLQYFRQNTKKDIAVLARKGKIHALWRNPDDTHRRPLSTAACCNIKGKGAFYGLLQKPVFL